MNKSKLITLLLDINENYFKGAGAVNRLNKYYPNILEYINKYSIEMQKYHANKKLYAKYLYLVKYGGDINKITKNNKIMIFDYNTYDFIDTAKNAANDLWKKYKFELSKINEFYSKDETIDLLKDNYLNYFGKLGNRKLLIYDKKLYSSVYHHTQEMDKLNINLKKFTHRLYILINKIEILCKKHKRYKFWKYKNNKFCITCPQCEPKYPSLKWFEKKYGKKDGIIKFNKRSKNFSELKINSLEWHIKKYGDELGEINYRNFVKIKMKNICQLKANRYSKISQDLFWNIYNDLDNKDNCYFYELNQEFVLTIPKEYKYNKTVMILDFKQYKKIIEYNGIYWHNDKEDKIRYDILRNMGFEIMVVTSNEYNRNNKNKEIIKKCINFLKC